LEKVFKVINFGFTEDFLLPSLSPSSAAREKVVDQPGDEKFVTSFGMFMLAGLLAAVMNSCQDVRAMPKELFAVEVY